MSHSPTPWYVVESVGGALSVRNVAGVLASHHHPWHYDGQDERYEQEVREYRGNFDLIAGAPDLLVAAQAAYTLLADIRNEWPGRNTSAGQLTLCLLRDAIAAAMRIDPQAVQDAASVAKIIGAQS